MRMLWVWIKDNGSWLNYDLEQYVSWKAFSCNESTLICFWSYLKGFVDPWSSASTIDFVCTVYFEDIMFNIPSVSQTFNGGLSWIIKTRSAWGTNTRRCASKFLRVKPSITARSANGGVSSFSHIGTMFPSQTWHLFPSYHYFHNNLTNQNKSITPKYMLVPTLARVYRSSVGMVFLKVLDANVGYTCYLSIDS